MLCSKNERSRSVKEVQSKIDFENLRVEEKYIVLYVIAKNAMKHYEFSNVVPINRIIRDCGIELSAWPMPGKTLLHDNLAESKKIDDKWIIYVAKRNRYKRNVD